MRQEISTTAGSSGFSKGPLDNASDTVRDKASFCPVSGVHCPSQSEKEGPREAHLSCGTFPEPVCHCCSPESISKIFKTRGANRFQLALRLHPWGRESHAEKDLGPRSRALGSIAMPVPSLEGGSTSVFVSPDLQSMVPKLLLSGGQLLMSAHPHVKAIRVKHFELLPVVEGQPGFYKPGKPGVERPGICGVENHPSLVWAKGHLQMKKQARPLVSYAHSLSGLV